MSAVGKLFKFISKTIIFLFALLGILTAAVIACLIVLASAIEPSVPSLPEKFALVLNLDEDIQENAQEDFMHKFHPRCWTSEPTLPVEWD